MAVKTLISEEDYLRTPYEDPAPEYILGELVERSIPNLSHSRVQKRLIVLFDSLAGGAKLFGYPELRIPVGAERYRIGDVVVFAGAEPQQPVPTELPILVAEIVSPADRVDDILSKLEDYASRGIAHVWVLDPGLRRGFVYADGGLRPVTSFELPEYGVSLALDAILN